MRNNPRMEVVTAGTVVAGRYRLDEPLGAGSTATVWRANDEMFEREVAVKLVGSGVAYNPTATRERLRREARAAARLRHRNVSRVLDYGEATLSDGTMQPFLVMELLTGESLAERLESGPMPWREALDVCAQVATGLEAVHEAGMVHRDVKPGNVFLTPDAVKLLDFGIVATAWDPSMTSTGQVVGTPWYLAPERLVGRGSGPASDIYALGCVLHHMLTGSAPFTGDDFTAIAEAHLHGPLPEPHVADLPQRAREMHDACLAKNPTARPTAARVAQGLRALLDADADAATGAGELAGVAAATTTVGAPRGAAAGGVTSARPDATLTDDMPLAAAPAALAEPGTPAAAAADQAATVTTPRPRGGEPALSSLRQRQQTRRGPDAPTLATGRPHLPPAAAPARFSRGRVPMFIGIGVLVALAAGIGAWLITAHASSPTGSSAAQTVQRLRDAVRRDENNGSVSQPAGESLLGWLNAIDTRLETPKGEALSPAAAATARQDIRSAMTAVSTQHRSGEIGTVATLSLDKQLAGLMRALPAGAN